MYLHEKLVMKISDLKFATSFLKIRVAAFVIHIFFCVGFAVRAKVVICIACSATDKYLCTPVNCSDLAKQYKLQKLLCCFPPILAAVEGKN